MTGDQSRTLKAGDRVFFGDAEGSSLIVQAVVNMASACHMSTTAEGVETQMQREILRGLGCSEMQGYLFSPAVPPSKLQRLLLPKASDAA